MKASARIYDGQTSKSQNIEIEINVDRVHFHLGIELKTYMIRELKIEAPFPNSPLIIYIPSGEKIEIPQYTDEMKKGLLKQKSYLLHYFENNYKIIASTVVVFIAIFYLITQVLIPAGSRTVARMIPQKYANKLDGVILKSFDDEYSSPSKLTQNQKDEIREFFFEHTPEDFEVDIKFRNNPVIGANAFALAGKTLVFTDQIIEKIPNKYHLLGIYLHELGHLKKRHVLSNIISALSIGIVATLVVGDLVGLTESLASAGITLISLKYSRSFETEADLFSAQLLRDHKLPARCFSEGLSAILSPIERIIEEKKDQKDQDTSAEIQVTEKISEYLSTHPDSKSRIKAITKLFPDETHCPIIGWESKKAETK